MKSKIYTKKGDSGETSLVSGKRVPKSIDRIKLYGDVDELNCYLGKLQFYLKDSKELKLQFELILKIQSALFDLGSNLACEEENRQKYSLPQLSQDLIVQMENQIDMMDELLPKLASFILPGGSLGACEAHICRTVTRRVERNLIEYEHKNNDHIESAVKFINRLSDYFFVLARYVNFKESIVEIKWVPSKN